MPQISQNRCNLFARPVASKGRVEKGSSNALKNTSPEVPQAGFLLLLLLLSTAALPWAQSPSSESGLIVVQMLDAVDSNQNQAGPFRATVAKPSNLGSMTIPAGANAVVTLESSEVAGAKFWSLKLEAVVVGGQPVTVAGDAPAITSSRVASFASGLIRKREIAIPPPLSVSGARVYVTARTEVRFSVMARRPQNASAAPPVAATSNPVSQSAVADAVPSSSQPAANAQIGGDVLTLQYSTFLSVPGYPAAHVENLALDANGNVLLGGSCGTAPFVAKLDRSGSFYHWFKVLARDVRACKLENFTGAEGPLGMVMAVAADPAGNIYATGHVYRTSLFPTVNAFHPAPPPGPQDQGSQPHAFVVRFSPNGQMEYSTLIGGNGYDYGLDVVSDKHNGAWVVGSTSSIDFPRVAALADCPANINSPDNFVIHLDERGKPTLASCLGLNSRQPYSANVSSDGDLYLTTDATPANVNSSNMGIPPGVLLRLSRANAKIGFRVSLDANPITIYTQLMRCSEDLAVGRDDSVLIVGVGKPFRLTSQLKLLHYGADGEKLSEKRLLEKVPELLSRQNPHFEPNYSLESIASASDGGLYATGQVGYANVLPGKPYELMARLVQVPVNTSMPQGFLMKFDQAGNPVWYMVLPPTIYVAGTRVRAVGNHVILWGLTPPADFPTTPGAVNRVGDPQPQNGDHWLMEFTEEPPTIPCSIRTSPSAFNVSNQGAQKQVLYVLPNRGGCQWSASSTAHWATLTPSSPGPGYGHVRIDFDTNLEGQRSGAIKIESPDAKAIEVPITQGPVACRYTMTPPMAEIASQRGGSVEVKVSTSQECDWSVKANQPWISLQRPRAKGSGSFVVAVSSNPTQDTRGGLLEIGTAEMVVVQHADHVAAVPAAEKIPRKAN